MRKITVYDSQGVKEENQQYLQYMLQYLGDVYRDQGGQDPTAWKREWTLVDGSDTIPRQSTGYDCGVFTIVNIVLMAQGIQVSGDCYEERTFLLRNTRQRIGILLWRASINKPTPRGARTRNTTTQAKKKVGGLSKPAAGTWKYSTARKGQLFGLLPVRTNGRHSQQEKICDVSSARGSSSPRYYTEACTQEEKEEKGRR